MSYAVRLLPKAKADYHELFDHIAERSPEGAIRWEAAFEAGLQRLRSNPQAYGFAPENRAFDRDLRNCCLAPSRA